MATKKSSIRKSTRDKAIPGDLFNRVDWGVHFQSYKTLKQFLWSNKYRVTSTEARKLSAAYETLATLTHPLDQVTSLQNLARSANWLTLATGLEEEESLNG